MVSLRWILFVQGRNEMINKISNDIRRDTAKTLPLEVGNNVIHSATGLRGTVIEKTNIAGLDVLSVQFHNGKVAHHLDRQEFRLCHL